jgi:hypothetical protein
MLAKCANVACNAPFRRLSEGKLFLLHGEAAQTREPLDPQKGKPPRRVEYFWLCNDCAGLVTLTFNHKTGVTTVPLPAGTSPIQASAHSAVEAQRSVGMLARTAGYQRG